MKRKPTYVLGTGLSKDGSACLLKDGKICVAIEKERLTRVKHDGGNDTAAIQYCLDAEGIRLHDLALVVQNATLGNFKYGNSYYLGDRLFKDDLDVEIVTISHHLAHAYSTIGTCPYQDCSILVIDGMGNPYDECTDLAGAIIPARADILPGMENLFMEKDSYYHYENNVLRTVQKDFSEFGYVFRNYPMHPNSTKHSIGGVYAAASQYCFRNISDAGKLMGLGPYGVPGVYKERIFDLRDGRVFVNYDWMQHFSRPARSYAGLKANFRYYADIAHWVQKEMERAILYVVNSRCELDAPRNLCYAGGVALNAVANARILADTKIKNLYIEPAAGDNGVAIGCAYYGWLAVLGRERVVHDKSTCFGVTYSREQIVSAIDACNDQPEPVQTKKRIDAFFDAVGREYKTTGGDHKPSTIQFNVANYGVYQVQTRKNGLTAANDILDAPTCVVSLDGDDLSRAILVPGYLEILTRAGKVSTTNQGEIEAFLELVDREKIAGLLRGSGHGTPATAPRVKYVIEPDYIGRTAELLAQGKVIGWFQDGSEFGPRALGRRSILADPRKAGVRDFINAQIKLREDFRPFAPSVLLEDASEYFVTGRESPYMILVDQVREEWKDVIGNVVHQDGSARVQTVTPDWNPKYHRLLREFKKRSGTSVLLNTSFNRKGMPIVETPEEALSFFFSCRLDCLVMHEYIIEKQYDPAPPPLRALAGQEQVLQ